MYGGILAVTSIIEAASSGVAPAMNGTENFSSSAGTSLMLLYSVPEQPIV